MNDMDRFADTRKKLFSWHTDEMVCPYCGYIHENSNELSSDISDYECDVCGRKFHYERETEVHYDTYRKEDREQC
jgi:transposase-like protein